MKHKNHLCCDRKPPLTNSALPVFLYVQRPHLSLCVYHLRHFTDRKREVLLYTFTPILYSLPPIPNTYPLSHSVMTVNISFTHDKTIVFCTATSTYGSLYYTISLSFILHRVMQKKGQVAGVLRKTYSSLINVFAGCINRYQWCDVC